MEDSTEMPAVASKLSSLSNLFKSTCQIYRRHFVVFSEIMLIPFVFALIIYFILLSGFLVPLTEFWFVFIIIFSTLVIAFFQLLAYAALIHCTKGNLGLISSFKSALHGFSSFLAVVLLVGLISLVGFGLLVIPGVIGTVWFCFAAYTLIFEERNVISSILRSRELVQGNFFPVLLRLIVAWIIVAVIGVLIPFLISLPGRFDPAIISQDNLAALVSSTRLFEALSFSASSLIGVFTTPFMVVFGIQIYRDLKRFKGE